MLQTKTPDAVHNVLCLPEACVLTISVSFQLNIHYSCKGMSFCQAAQHTSKSLLKITLDVIVLQRCTQC